MPSPPHVLFLLQANKLVKYLMIKDYKKIPIKRSGGQLYPHPELCPPSSPSPPQWVPHQALADGSMCTVRGLDSVPLSRAVRGAAAPWPPLSPGAFPHVTPPADMLKDVIREYDEHFPEIIERATYTLEKVGVGMGAALWNKSGREALPSFSTWELPLHTSSPGFLSLSCSLKHLLSPEVGPVASASARAPTGQLFCILCSPSPMTLEMF